MVNKAMERLPSPRKNKEKSSGKVKESEEVKEEEKRVKRLVGGGDVEKGKVKSEEGTTGTATTTAMTTSTNTNTNTNANTMTKEQQLLQLLSKMDLTGNTNLHNDKYSIIGKCPSKEHRFWNTQPVIQSIVQGEKHDGNTDETQVGPIETIKKIEDIRPTPYTLPPGYEWCDMDLVNDEQSHEVYHLLTENYVEDDDNMFRFDYSIEFLKWALLPPGFMSTLHIGVRNKGKLVAFISGIPVKIRVRDSTMDMVEINFLCIHKKLRSKRLAPVLIKEITRRTNLKNIFQAAYTAGIVLPTPIGECRYYHRSINPKKLIDVKFSYLPQNMTLARVEKMYKLPENIRLDGLRPMTRKDVGQVCKLFKKHMDKYSLVHIMNEKEIEHWLLPRENVIYSYVVANEKNEVTDFCSFYHLPSSIIGNQKYKTLHAAYSYYNIATSVSLVDLMSDALILARNNNFDVFNALNCMENDIFLQNLKFGVGDGTLQYYLYNWKCPRMNPRDIGLILC